MSTRIELQGPYALFWKRGYLSQHQDGRRVLMLTNDDGNRLTISYARYLYVLHTGMFIPEGYEVDHINNDCTDDRFENYQLLTPEQNRLKEYLRRIEETYEVYILSCAGCGNLFMLDNKEYRYRKSIGRVNFYCTQKCSGTYAGGTSAKTQEVISQIRDYRISGLSSYEISNQLGISRNTVMKYW